MLNKINNVIKIFAFYFLITLSVENKLNAQNKEKCTKTIVNNTIVFSSVDKMPVFKKNINDALNFFSKNAKLKINSLNQTQVDLEFIVLSNGKLDEMKIYNKNRKDYTNVDKEYLRVLSTMPKWHAGECNGKKVVVKMRLPIKLELNL